MSDTTLYQNIADQLLLLIEQENILSHEKIPSIRQLKKKFEVSETTIISAIRLLEEKQILQSIHGKGVFVRSWNDDLAVYCEPECIDYIRFIVSRHNTNNPNMKVTVESARYDRTFPKGIYFAQHQFLPYSRSHNLLEIDGIYERLSRIYPNTVSFYDDNRTVFQFPLFFDLTIPIASENFLRQHNEERFISYSGLDDFRAFIGRVGRNIPESDHITLGKNEITHILSRIIWSGIGEKQPSLSHIAQWLSDKSVIQSVLGEINWLTESCWKNLFYPAANTSRIRNFCKTTPNVSLAAGLAYPGSAVRTPVKMYGLSVSHDALPSNEEKTIFRTLLDSFLSPFALEGGYQLLKMFPTTVENSFIKDIPLETVSDILRSVRDPFFVPPDNTIESFIVDRISEYIYFIACSAFDFETGLFCIEELLANFQKYQAFQNRP